MTRSPITKETRSFEPSNAKAVAKKRAEPHQQKELTRFPYLLREPPKCADPHDDHPYHPCHDCHGNCPYRYHGRHMPARGESRRRLLMRRPYGRCYVIGGTSYFS